MIPGARVTAGATGSVIDLRTPRTGRVHSVFAHARGGHDAALTVRLSGAVLPGDLGLSIHDPVCVRSNHLRAGPAVIDARTAVRWLPRRYDVDPGGHGERVAALSTGATSGGDTCAGLVAAGRLLSRSLEGITA